MKAIKPSQHPQEGGLYQELSNSFGDLLAGRNVSLNVGNWTHGGQFCWPSPIATALSTSALELQFQKDKQLFISGFVIFFLVSFVLFFVGIFFL